MGCINSNSKGSNNNEPIQPMKRQVIKVGMAGKQQGVAELRKNY